MRKDDTSKGHLSVVAYGFIGRIIWYSREICSIGENMNFMGSTGVKPRQTRE